MARFTLILCAVFSGSASAGATWGHAAFFEGGPSNYYEWTPTAASWYHAAPGDSAYSGLGTKTTVNSALPFGTPVGKAVGVSAASGAASYGTQLALKVGAAGQAVAVVVKQAVTPAALGGSAVRLMRASIPIAIGSALGTWLYNAGVRYFSGESGQVPSLYIPPSTGSAHDPASVEAWVRAHTSYNQCLNDLPCNGGSQWWQTSVVGSTVNVGHYKLNPPGSCYAGYPGYTGSNCGFSVSTAIFTGVATNAGTYNTAPTDQQILDKLTPTTIPNPAGAVGDAVGLGDAPIPGPSVTSGPSTLSGGTKTTYNPDGSKTVVSTVYNITYNNNNTNITQTDTQTDYDANGDQVGTPKTITHPPDSPPSTQQPTQEQKQLCEVYPDVLACEKMGSYSPDTPSLPSHNVDVTITPVAMPSGSCPADLTASYLGVPITISWAPLCTFAEGMRPVVLAAAWLLAAYIVFAAPHRGGSES